MIASINLSSIHSSTNVYIYPHPHYLLNNPSLSLLIHLSSHPSIHPLIHFFQQSSNQLCILSLIYQSIHLSHPLPTHQIIHAFINPPSIYPFTRTFIHMFIHHLPICIFKYFNTSIKPNFYSSRLVILCSSHPSTNPPSIHLIHHLLTKSCKHSLLHHPSIYPSIYPFNIPYTHGFICPSTHHLLTKPYMDSIHPVLSSIYQSIHPLIIHPTNHACIHQSTIHHPSIHSTTYQHLLIKPCMHHQSIMYQFICSSTYTSIYS